MRNKNLVVGLAVVIVLFIAAIAFIVKPIVSKKETKKLPAPAATRTAGKAAQKTPAKKVFSKDKGGLTVKIVDVNNKPMSLRIKVFKATDGLSSIYVASFSSNSMAELTPGNYDIEVETLPQKIYKDINISNNKETVKDLGCVMGSLNVKALNSDKANTYYPLRILFPGSDNMVASGATNRVLNIVPGVYDIEVGMQPVQARKDVRVENNKETVVDLGCIVGTLIVKARDENNRDARYRVNVKQSGKNERTASSMTNNSIELVQGVYDVEIFEKTTQVKKGVKINAGEKVVIDVSAQSPPAPQM